MTIDPYLLREDEDGTNLKEVLSWQKARYGDEVVEEFEKTLVRLKALESKRRCIEDNLKGERRRLKAVQLSLAPGSEDRGDPASSRSDIKILKQSIQKLVCEARSCDEEHTSLLPRFGNCVDTKVTTSKPSQIRVQRKSRVNQDPIFCIGGYESISHDKESATELTGPGLQLSRSIIDVGLAFFQTKETGLRELTIPLSMKESDLHSLLGCQPTSVPCPQVSIAAPSFVRQALEEKSRTYWDSQLPRKRLFLVSDSNPSQNLSEEQRIASFGRHTTRNWFHRCKASRVELSIMTTPRLEESRKAQRMLADQIKDLFESLLVTHTPLLVSERLDSPVRISSVSPSELMPCEASRLLVQGFLCGEYATLGYVSNFGDYLSRDLKIRCGGATGEFVHMVHGALCSSAEILEWIGHNNLVTMGSDDGGVGLPRAIGDRCFEPSIDASYDVWVVPFVRRLRTGGKAGKKAAIDQLKGAGQPRPILFGTQKSDRPKVATARRISCQVYGEKATNDEATLERLSCPFDFLPLR